MPLGVLPLINGSRDAPDYDGAVGAALAHYLRTV